MRTKYFKQLKRERSVAPFIPYSSHVTPTTIATKSAEYIRTWRVAGLGFETTDPDEIALRKEQLNTLLRSIGSEHIAIWSHNIRRKTSDRLHSLYDNSFCRDLDEKYYGSFNGYRMMANELYLTVVYRKDIGPIRRVARLGSRRTTEEILRDQREAIRKIDAIALQIEAGMRRYGMDEKRGIEPLTAYEEEGVYYSELLTFLNFLVSGVWQKVRVPNCSLDEYLGNAWIFIGAETIEMRSPIATRFAQCIDFKDYAAHTEPGILNGLLYHDFEYVMTQSFSFYAQRQGKGFLERQINQFRNAQDGSVSQIGGMETAVDKLLQGEFAMGEYHYSLMVFGDTVEQARRNTTNAMNVLQDRGFLAALVSTATDAAFYAQLPGNFSYRPRIATLTTKNFAGLSSFHNFRSGKRDGNPWGPAVTLLKTPSGQPLFLNFHYSKGDEDNFDKKLLGNLRMIGQSGAGKTVLMNFAFCQAQKFKHGAPLGFYNVIFDKDEGAKLTVLACGGKYLSVKNGRPTGFNPFQMKPTEDNILFLERLVRILVSGEGREVTPSDELRISHAVRTVMTMPREERRLSTVIQNITEGSGKAERDNSVAKRLSRWCADDGYGKRGSLWWVLDCPEDKLDFESNSILGIDGTDFLDNADIRTPVSMYLLHRMESIIDGRRFIYWMDEAWKWVDDEAFSEFAGNKQLTIRKQNGLGVFATQMPSSLLNSRIASALVQQVATEIYLPNPKADHREYVEGFKLTEAEFRLVRSMGEESRTFLIKQGHQSMIGRLDLSGFDDELAILSGSSDNNELLDRIIAEVGDDPDVWLPIFHSRRKSRILSSRKAA